MPIHIADVDEPNEVADTITFVWLSRRMSFTIFQEMSWIQYFGFLWFSLHPHFMLFFFVCVGFVFRFILHVQNNLNLFYICVHPFYSFIYVFQSVPSLFFSQLKSKLTTFVYPLFATDRNPITGEGYHREINTTVPSLNGAKQVINKNRIPPGGFSSGLW